MYVCLSVIGVSFCGFGMLCAAGLAFLLRYKAQDGIESKHIIGLMTLSEMKKMPVTYWLHTTGLAFAAACWICKQDNLPDYLEWRYGYTMTEASYITGTSAMMFILSPFFTIVLKKFDCDGVMVTLVSILMIPLYVLLGFCQSVNVYAIALLDGTFCSLFSLLAMQIAVMLCPANYVGTLSGVLYFVRNIIVALAFVAAGYILEKHSLTNLTKTMDGYKNFFLMAIAMSSVASVLW
ncbi:lysosomal dipeptide transporter MFSD1-like [Argopecten irradians]|uniref:lysosomal dipeptide transporter MFSD1-like n=1 Tax=Argopecten irradians TaxID=31199 RepID=UPI00371C5188